MKKVEKVKDKLDAKKKENKKKYCHDLFHDFLAIPRNLYIVFFLVPVFK